MQHQYKVDSGCSGAAAALQPHPCTITIPPPEPTLTLLEEVPPHIQQKKQDHRKLILPFVFFLEKVLGALWYHHFGAPLSDRSAKFKPDLRFDLLIEPNDSTHPPIITT